MARITGRKYRKKGQHRGITGLAAACAILTAVLLYKHPKTRKFSDEVASEVSKA